MRWPGVCASLLADPPNVYCDALGFEIVKRSSGEIVLSLGAQHIVLVQAPPGMTAQPELGPDVRCRHVAIVDGNMQAAFAHLRQPAAVAIGRGGPQQPPAASGGVCAFKFRDLARLDGLDDATIEVVALMPRQARTPYLELLDYIRPKAVRRGTYGPATADRLVWQAQAVKTRRCPVHAA